MTPTETRSWYWTLCARPCDKGPSISIPFSLNLLNYYWEVQARRRHEAYITLHGYTVRRGEVSVEFERSSLKSVHIILPSLESISVTPPLP